MVRNVWGVGAALLLGAAGGCGSSDGATGMSNPPGVQTLLLGAVMDQGSASAYYSWPSAAKLAIDQINDGLTQAGASVRIKLDLSDTNQDATVATMSSLDL